MQTNMEDEEPVNEQNYLHDLPNNQQLILNEEEASSQLTHKQQLINNNIKLKTQIYDLNSQLSAIIANEKNIKKKYINESDDEVLREKKIQLKKQQLQILQLRNKIYAIKRQLENTYNSRSLIAKEDQLKYLKQQLSRLNEEKQNLLRIKSDQTRAISSFKSQEEFAQRLQDMKKQLMKAKQESKILNERLQESERILRKNHEQYITKQTKVRELQQRLIVKKEKNRNRQPTEMITYQMLTDLEEEVEELEKQRKEEEEMWHTKINSIDSQLKEKKLQQERKLMILKEKQKQLKLNELKIKELRRLIRHNEQQGLKTPTNIDMRQFRYKRNIKYLEK